jgi:hypothetical protein
VQGVLSAQVRPNASGFTLGLAQVAVGGGGSGSFVSSVSEGAFHGNVGTLLGMVASGNQTGGVNNLSSSGLFWDRYNGQGGTFHFDVPYDPSIHGFEWYVVLSSLTEAKGGAAISDFSHTLALSSVTLTNGTPVDVTFDSGLTFGTVPEPTSMTLLGIAGACIAAYGRRQKTAHQTAGR